ncbi:type 1 glutamine amidotransferase domain-containing protein [Rhodococcus sp. PvR099]|uniref:type 1 glutamine amidotransferase domain-containing protein n=1 Tax=Rhodococcus sp. PvR099 TaxID=2806602 RepID=UPI001AE744BE|nr:type 1 glutamine amidotransferase domain-containing protein [Rhodococcus sp. PvR099]MBP1162411.1 protease I [Rhodococcus sp. PvR099]
MSRQLEGHRVAILATDGVEQDELIEPRRAVEEAGAAVTLISLEPGEIQAFRADVQQADRFPVDLVVSRASVDDFDGLILPGGTMNPDRLRVDDHAVAFVRHFVHVGKPVGAIGHGPWMLLEADVVGGRTLTSWPSLRTDIINAGGSHVNEKVVVDRNLITSRGPADLHWFCAAIVGKFTQMPQPVEPL